MLIALCKKEGIKTIGTVRRAEQVKLLKSDHVINTSDKNWKEKMGGLCSKLNPTGCFEAISGDMTGEMLNFLSPGGTCILYGLLSAENAGNINSVGFLFKGLKLESFLLNVPYTNMTPAQKIELKKKG